jgi:Ser/Thr protein kinase RdoA (MazF antagonist)
MDKALVDARYTPAAVHALTYFPVEPLSIELVNHSENVTWRVSVQNSDTDLVLRLHRPGYNSLEELVSERAWAAALYEAGVPVPQSIPTWDDELFVMVDIPGSDEQRFAGVTTWFEGAPLCDHLETGVSDKERCRIFGRMGELLAAMHNQATSWRAPTWFTRQRLDIDGLLGEAPRWGRFWDHAELSDDEKALLLGTREALRERLKRYGETPDNFSIIHSDMNPDNVVYNEGELAVIDFDDSAYGWHMYDIASALIDDRSASDFDAVRAALQDGYLQHRPLASGDIDMLPAFLLIRGMAIIGWYHQRPEHAGSRFLDDMKNWVLAQCETGDWQ